MIEHDVTLEIEGQRTTQWVWCSSPEGVTYYVVRSWCARTGRLIPSVSAPPIRTISVVPVKGSCSF